MSALAEPDPAPAVRRVRRRPVPTVLQMETTECAAACLGMILAFHGQWVPLETLRIQCGVSRDGANAARMLRTARDHGMDAQGYRSDVANLLSIPFPMIVFWEGCHFVVLEGMRGDSVHVNDPAAGPQRMSLREFEDGYSGICFGFRPGPGFRKGGSPPGTWGGLVERLGDAWAPLGLAALATLFLVVPGVAVPGILKVFVDDVLIRGADAWVGPLLAGLALAAALQAALILLQHALLARMEVKLAAVATTRFLWHVMSLPSLFFSQRHAGEIASRIQSNDRVAQLVSRDLSVNLVNVLSMVVYGGVMLAYDVLLTAVATALVVANLLVLHLSARARDGANRRFLKEQGRVEGASVRGIQMMETLKATAAENDFFARWSGIHANALNAQHRLGLVSVATAAFPPLFSMLMVTGILGIGGLRVLEGDLSIGGLVAFQSLALSFSRPVEGLVRFGANLQLVKGDIARLDDVLNHEPEPRAACGLAEVRPEGPLPRGAVSLGNVTFGYSAGEAPLIDGFTLSVAPGQRVALVGGSGSGKSTVARLACGLLSPWSGTVEIDGRELAGIPPSRFAEIVSHVDQEIVLFRGTVRENVTLWDPSLDERDVVQALRDAAIHDAVASLPGKLDAIVEEGGRNFSGGQRQRLEIARALVRNPAVVVLDEATAALDPLTELELDDRLRRRGCTCLIIAHRLSTVRDADEIVVLDRGRIAQRGRHEQLIREDGPYRSLVMSE